MDPLLRIASVMLLLTLGFYGCVGNVDMKNISNNLSQDLNALKTEELGVSFIEKLFRNFKLYANDEDLIINTSRAMAHKLENKINNIFSAINNATLLLDNLLSNRLESFSVLLPCTSDKNSAFDVLISSNLINNHSINEYFGSKYILYEMRRNMTLIPNALKQQYFMSDKDIRNIQYSPFSQCSDHDENIVWKNYMSHQKYQRKNVILVLDHGGSLSYRQLQIAKTIAKATLKYLEEHDRVALIAVASDWSYTQTGCTDEKGIKPSIFLQDAKAGYLSMLDSFIDSLNRGSGATNHVIGMQKSLDVILNTQDFGEQDMVMVTYISRGLLSSLTEARSVLKIIAQQTEDIKLPVYIHTCAVIDESKPVMYETHFLKDIAHQNFSKYNITTYNRFRYPGYMLTVNKTDDIGFVINRFFSIFNTGFLFKTDKQISLPYWDPQSKDLTVSFTSGWMSNNNFVMLGTDIFFSNIGEDLSYYSSNQQYSYAFMTDLQGKVLLHPSISRPSVVNYQISFIDVKYLETVDSINILRKKLLTEQEGTFRTKNNNNETLQYAWTRVGQWYVVCIVLNESHEYFNKPFKASPSASVKKLLYQNLEGSENYKFCRHLNQIATLDVASLYLSSSCFQSPFSASKATQDKLIVQGYLAYLKDDTRLLTNPGLKDAVRDEVAALAHVLDFLRKRHLSSEMSKYIVRRYASSYSGVLQMFPGSVLAPGLETTKRPWFLRALQHPNKIILIPPYLDKGGAGYIVTIAYATPYVVSAIDVTHGYMLKILLKHMPHCLSEKVTCFLTDDQGYIIYHPKLMDFDEKKPIEQQHIVHRESLIANDILSHKHFIRKLLCNNYADNTIQRYYRLNTSYTDVLANLVPGEHGVTYRITSVPDTNIFIGVVNASSDVVATFCPCNVVDRLCFNCNRMEEKECECPCECSLESEPKSCQENNQNQTDNAPCKWYAEETPSVEANFASDVDNKLEQCFPINCQNERTQMSCLGVIGCEWCKYDITKELLKKPFCSSLIACFNGVYGSATPYRGPNDLTDTPESEFSPLGPILGLIIAMCMLFILLYICYRSYTNPSVDRLYLSSTHDQLRMSDVNVNDNYHDLGNHRDKLLKEDCPAPDPISPYCVATNYRRNNAAADSDHGYSTMTPHDESEHLSLAPMEVDSLEDDVLSDSTSVHTSLSFKNNPSHVVSPVFTKIPYRNCMVVPVTVHRNMETT
ncbi:VWFA and cache domain-containing protein 1 [Sitophilus oryzae]|uniref:VWFA and cache domain-containing protein 1 n=1 Tax=Sitophilus oryzae TaxID=7048 RepID=A0A6J2XC16_SITOR|nr:VWFA and cache domain-containing protein 1 [Sitophilus oryzae]